MRIPEAGPLGDTFGEANVRAISGALLVKRPGGGNVETVLTPWTHLRLPWAVMRLALAALAFLRAAFFFPFLCVPARPFICVPSIHHPNEVRQ